MNEAINNRPYIRPPLISDARHVAAMAAEFAEFHNDTASVSEYDIMTDICGENPRCQVLILETDELVAGYAAGYFTYQIHRARAGFEVQSLYIRERHRARGFGKLLLRAMAQQAVENGAKRVTLGADMANEPAMRFYERLGFKAGRAGSWIKRYTLEGRELREFIDGKV